MSPSHAEEERWRHLRRALERAVEAEPDQREALLRAELGDDPTLLAEARELLRQDGAEGLEPPTDLGARLSNPAATHVGPYVLKHELGRGGMGTVHLAARADGTFERRVAIKRLRGGGPEVVARFERERQVLANLEHPAIARLIDGGVEADGSPYLVMEYVQGERIDRACDEARLTVPERVRLFRRVCEAVSFAHERLVVHRDLKPSNILVDAQGEPKLLDFGVAKVLDPEKAASDPELTLAGSYAFTPAYASPEQVRGRPATATSDVYSLGVLLHQLLTGRLPYELDTTSAAELERIVCETEPPPPSVAATSGDAEESERLAHARGRSPRQLERELRGDLDNIVTMALRKEPGRRYGSVERLSADLGRYLEGLPVTARPATLAYRSSRFLRRNRRWLAAGVLAFAGLGVGLVVAVRQAQEARDARAAEAAERALATERADELEHLAARLDEQRALAVERAEELERQGLELEREKELARSRLEDVRSFAMRLVFDVFGEIAPLEGAERARELVIELGTQHLATIAEETDEPSALDLRALSSAYLRLGDVRTASVEPGAPGGDDAALALMVRGLELAEEARAMEPGDPRNGFSLAQALLTVSERRRALGRLASARALDERALEVTRGLVEVEDVRPGFRFVHGLALDKARVRALQEGRLDEARALLDELESGTEALIAQLPSMEYERVGLHQARAEQLAAEGRHDAAVDERRAALELAEEFAGQAPANADLAVQAVLSRVGLARGLWGARRAEEAEQVLQPLLAEGDDPSSPAAVLQADELADAERLGAYVALALDRPQLALERAESAAARLEARIAGTSETSGLGADLARAHRVRARALRALGRLDAAETALRACLASIEELEELFAEDPSAARLATFVRGELGRLLLEKAAALPERTAWRNELEDRAHRLVDAALRELDDLGDDEALSFAAELAAAR